MENLHLSSLSTFLSDKQILVLIRLFQDSITTEHKHDHLGGNDEENDNNENAPQDIGVNNSIVSSQRSSIRKNNSIIFGGTNMKLEITKDTFVSKYPKLLHELVGKKEEKRQPFDIHFNNLTLTVKEAGNQTKTVVNKVTGRIQHARMTALMGE